MPASRPYWKGYLKLSFVSCPVALYPATSAAERVSFRQVNRRTGHRLKHKLVDSITGEEIDASDKARGYEIGENEFLFVEDRDLAQARSERPPPGSRLFRLLQPLFLAFVVLRRSVVFQEFGSPCRDSRRTYSRRRFGQRN